MSSRSGNKKALFWTSYSDLMTSLFFTMLVLFVVVVIAMGQTNIKLRELLNNTTAEKEQLERITHLKDQFQTLTESGSLEYDEEKCMFYVKDFVGIEIFEPNQGIIKPEYISTVDEVGKEIKSIINALNSNNGNFKFQLVIEGTAAIPFRELVAKTYNPDNKEIYLLSYIRALALYERWKHLKFRIAYKFISEKWNHY